MTKFVDLGLYIHWPFCRRICHYCDFTKSVSSNDFQIKYMSYLLKELSLHNLKDVKTIYLGGGTPSSMDFELLKSLLEHIKLAVDETKIVEFTIEVNPEDASEEFISIIENSLVNRISLGIQSLSEKHLLELNRPIITKEELDLILERFMSHGFNNISIDLIYGLSEDELILDSIDGILASKKVKHLSLYSLILEERTVFGYRSIHGGYIPKVTEDYEATTYKKISSFLKKKGFNHYEISNYALPGYESNHNLIYWTDGSYLGLGLGASSYLETRLVNHHKFGNYFQDLDNVLLPIEESLDLTKIEKAKDYLMMGLRTKYGVSQDVLINKYGYMVSRDILDSLKEYLDISETISIKPKYWYISNQIIGKLIE